MSDLPDRSVKATRWLVLALFAAGGVSDPATAGVTMAINRQITMGAAGTPSDNCAGLVATLGGLAASSQTPYLVRLEPGTFDCRSTTLTLPPFVDLEGAGRGRTAVLVSGLGLRLSDNQELRHLTVVGGTFFAFGGVACAVSASGDGAPRLTHVALETDGGGLNCGLRLTNGSSPILTDVEIRIDRPRNTATNVGIDATSSSATLDRVRIHLDGTPLFGAAHPAGYGIRISGNDLEGDLWLIDDTQIEVERHQEAVGLSVTSYTDDLTITGSRIEALAGDSHSDALYNEARYIAVVRSALTGSTHAIHNVGASEVGLGTVVVVTGGELTGAGGTIESDSGYWVLVGGSKLAGGASDAGGGVLTCAAVRDENHTFHASTCP